MKRVLITSYQSAYLYHGGGEREVFLLADALNRSNILADIYGPTSLPISKYDCVVHFSLSPSNTDFLVQIKKSNKPIYLWPNIWFLEIPSKEAIDMLNFQLKLFDGVIFKSQAEENNCRQYLSFPEEMSIRVQTGVSSSFEKQHTSDLFINAYGIKDYIFWPGIIEPQKNQLNAVLALKDTPSPVVFSGDVRNADYFDACKAAASPLCYFLPEMPWASDLFLSALHSCKVFLEVPLDFPGVSAIEAALAGCNMVVTDCSWSHENFGNDVAYANPNSTNHIFESVRHALGLESSGINNTNLYKKNLIPTAYKNFIDMLS